MQPQQMPVEEAELNAVVESISFGKVFQHKKLSFQAFSAAISHQDQVTFIMGHLNDVNNKVHSRFPSAKNKILAYRASQMDQLQQKEDTVEGFDDDGEDGAGEKLLNQLQRMEIENILVIVCIWQQSSQIGGWQLNGGQLFKIILDRAKELLNTIHEQIIQSQKQQQQLENQKQANMLTGQKQAIGTKTFTLSQQQNQQSPRTGGFKGTTPFKGNLGDRTRSLGRSSGEELGLHNTDEDLHYPKEAQDETEKLIIDNYQEELGHQDLEDCQREVEQSLRQITKANLIELKQYSKPNAMVDRVMQIVCVLKGFKNPNWGIAKELLAKAHFKIELMQLNSDSLKASDVLKAQQILNSRASANLTPQNLNLHSEAAALLLVWSSNIIKLFACNKKLGNVQASDFQKVKQEEQQRNNYQAASIPKNEIQGGAQVSHRQGDAQTRQAEQLHLKPQNVGHFLKNKQMVFNADGQSLTPKKHNESNPTYLGAASQTNETNSNSNKLNINVPGQERHLRLHEKKQSNFSTITGDQLSANPNEQMTKSNQKSQIAKGGQQASAQNQQLTNQSISQQQQNAQSSYLEEDMSKILQENPTGEGDLQNKLKMNEVKQLPQGVDAIIDRLKGVDYGNQDLEVLIELAKQLKYKRQILFPDTSNVLLSDNVEQNNEDNEDQY